MAVEPGAFRVERLGSVGATLPDVDLRAIDDVGFAAIRAALYAHGLLVLRDQAIGHAEQVAFARRFGALEGLGRETGGEHPEVIAISNLGPDGRVLPRSDAQMMSLAVNEQWHTDSSFREVPSTVSVFRAAVLPESGGDTWYASLRAGWLALSEAERAELVDLRAVHDYARSWQRLGATAPAVFRQAPVRHPLVRVHPETGEPSLYLSDHAYEIEGRTRDGGGEGDKGRALIERLLDICTQPEVVYRHQWRPGDVLVWDNRTMLHRAQGFDETHPRVMYHVRVAGEPLAATG